MKEYRAVPEERKTMLNRFNNKRTRDYIMWSIAVIIAVAIMTFVLLSPIIPSQAIRGALFFLCIIIYTILFGKAEQKIESKTYQCSKPYSDRTNERIYLYKDKMIYCWLKTEKWNFSRSFTDNLVDEDKFESITILFDDMEDILFGWETTTIIYKNGEEFTFLNDFGNNHQKIVDALREPFRTGTKPINYTFEKEFITDTCS